MFLSKKRWHEYAISLNPSVSVCPSQTNHYTYIAAQQACVLSSSQITVTVDQTHGCDWWRNAPTGVAQGDFSEGESPISVFPNPASESVEIRFGAKGNGNRMVVMTDLQGRIVSETDLKESDTSVKINCRHFANGIYFVSVFDQHVTRTFKVVVMK